MDRIVPHLSPTVRAGRLLFVSGQLAFDAAGEIAGSVGAQTKQVLTNIAEALAVEGLGLDDVVKTTAWIRRADDFAEFNLSYSQVFVGNRPARSTVVSALVPPTALVEIEAVALLR